MDKEIEKKIQDQQEEIGELENCFLFIGM